MEHFDTWTKEQRIAHMRETYTRPAQIRGAIEFELEALEWCLNTKPEGWREQADMYQTAIRDLVELLASMAEKG